MGWRLILEKREVIFEALSGNLGRKGDAAIRKRETTDWQRLVEEQE